MAQFDFAKGPRAGVDDMVLMPKVEETQIVDNLKKRYASDLIYTYIGPVLIAVNPFRDLGINGLEYVERYKNKFRYENPPHIFALAESAYRSMVNNQESQCVIISGESGAGKTESAKLIMKYIAAVSGRGGEVERVKNIILETNPLLEAFGNAKTIRNNNSSRFGKYFEIQFSVSGDPQGGKITNYLLEKSRVVYQARDERNFHIFYLLCKGCTAEERREFQVNNPQDFHYLNQSGCYEVDGIDDAEWMSEVRHAMDVIGIDKGEQHSIFKLLAGILWLGNVSFVDDGSDKAKVADESVLNYAAYLLGLEPMALQMALMFRRITTGGFGRKRGSTYNVPQNVEQAGQIRDALSKALYDRLFDWLVDRVNKAMATDQRDPLVISVLDIFGFEIFKNNGFEQFCINYVNEKLQQIFIELTLKAEQEEYVKEGIKWTPIKYFNNKIVCDLIESRMPPGVFSVLDDTCHTIHGMDNAKADEKFVGKCDENFATHAHYQGRGAMFVIKHYAGDVTYNSAGFTEKNRDQLYITLIECMQSSSDGFIRSFFPEDTKSDNRKKPTTAGFKIKNSAQALVEALMRCQPHYIRCIKPNETKRPRDWDNSRVAHQAKYLGLLENVRVRRAGFAYRREYSKFLDQFGVLSDQTWPNPWRGDARAGCEALLKDLKVDPNEYQFGSTKLFLRSPETLFSLEEQKERRYHEAATTIIRTFRSYRMRKYFLELRQAATDLFVGKKERRRLSINRQFMGDYVNFLDNAQLQEKMKDYIEEEVVFGDIVNKPVRKRFRGHRIDKVNVLVTNQALYFIERIKKKKQYFMELTKRARLPEITGVSLSTLQDNYVVVHIQSQEDLLFECDKKTELVSILNDNYKQLNHRDIPITFSNAVQYQANPKGKKKTVEFKKDENPKFKLANLTGSSSKWSVTINSGLPADTKPKQVQSKGAAGGAAAGSTQRRGFQSSMAATSQQQSAYGQSVQKHMPAAPPKPAPPPPTRSPQVRALYDYAAQSGDELTIHEGDVINLIGKDPSGWWEGEMGGKRGLFPGNYVQEL